MAWDADGNRFPRYFKSHAESQAACVAIWRKSYKHFPDLALAKKWTGGDNPAGWLATVTKKYNSL
jgi:hypothetical protein